MARAAGKPFFAGSQTIATVDDLDAFVRRAAAEESFTYCEAPDLIRSETSARVTELAGDGLVRPHRRRREGGGWTFYVVRTRRGLPEKPDPIRDALQDPATDLIFRAIKRAANFRQPCPSDVELARVGGLNSRHQSSWRVRKLVDVGLIKSSVLYDGGIPSRVVTIEPTKYAGDAAGKFTALPRKWAELQAAAARDLAAGGGAQ